MLIRQEVKNIIAKYVIALKINHATIMTSNPTNGIQIHAKTISLGRLLISQMVLTTMNTHHVWPYVTVHSHSWLFRRLVCNV